MNRRYRLTAMFLSDIGIIVSVLSWIFEGFDSPGMIAGVVLVIAGMATLLALGRKNSEASQKLCI